MGCPISPAALLVQQARQAESQDLLSDTEDDVRTVTRAAGPLKSWLEDDIETSSEASSDSGENSLRCSHPAHLRGSLSSALQVQLHHQQQASAPYLFLMSQGCFQPCYAM